MRALFLLTGAEKARLLHDLFPNEIPALLDSITEFCKDFKERKEEYRKHWSDGFIPFEYWQNLAEETAGILKKHKFSMLKSSKVFSDQLYYTYTSMFVTNRIIKYAEKVSEDEKFKQAVILIFT